MKHTKITILLAITFLLAVTIIPSVHIGSAQENSTTEKTDEEKLKHLKKVLWKKAYREQDTKLLDRILAEEFQVIYDDGTWSDKKGEMEFIKTNKPTYDSFEYEIKRLDIFENGTAIVAGEGHVTGKNEKGKYEYRYQSSNVLIKQNGIWKAVASHVSGIKRKETSKDK